MAIKDMFLKRDDEEDDEYDRDEDYTIQRTQRTADNTGTPSIRVELFEPAAFEDAGTVAAQIKAGKPAIVNLQRLPRDMAQRTIDFLTGIVFGVDGTIQKVGHNVILCTPHNFETEGSISLDNPQQQ